MIAHHTHTCTPHACMHTDTRLRKKAIYHRLHKMNNIVYSQSWYGIFYWSHRSQKYNYLVFVDPPQPHPSSMLHKLHSVRYDWHSAIRNVFEHLTSRTAKITKSFTD